MDFLLFPGGIIGVVVVLFFYLRKQETAQRALQIAKTNLSPSEDIESGYAAVASSMRALRRAKQEEHQLLLKNWQNGYLELLPDTDPEKTTHQATLQGVSIETAGFALDKNGMRMNGNEVIVVDDGPEWRPLPYSKKDPDEGLTYSERRIQSAGAFVRSEPHTTASVFGVAEGGSIMSFDGYVYGEPVSGNDIWFVYVGQKSKLRKYVHSIATTNRSTSGMSYMPAEPVTAHFNPKVYYYNDGSIKCTDTLEEDLAWQETHWAKVKRGDYKYLDPDQEKEKQRIPAIVKNYQKDRSKIVSRL